MGAIAAIIEDLAKDSRITTQLLNGFCRKGQRPLPAFCYHWHGAGSSNVWARAKAPINPTSSPKAEVVSVTSSKYFLERTCSLIAERRGPKNDSPLWETPPPMMTMLGLKT